MLTCENRRFREMGEGMLRLIFSVLANLALGLVGFAAGAFDLSGLVAVVACGSVITYALGPGGFAVVLAFVAAGSLTTRVRFTKSTLWV